MKEYGKLSWIAVGMALFLSLSVILNLASVSAFTKEDKSKVQDCYPIMVEADELYLGGEEKQAAVLYRQCKPEIATSSVSELPDPVYNIEDLEGGHRLWEKALDGIEKNLDSKIYFHLVPLIDNYPQFIPAYLKLAEFCQNDEKFCAQNAKEGQPKDAISVLETATELYPGDPDLLKAKIEVLVAAEEYLEASIAARQFALIYPDYEEASEFEKLADQYLEKFQSKVKSDLIGQAIASGLLSIGSAVITGNPYQSLTGLDTLLMMLQGEEAFGEQAAAGFVSNYQQKGELVQNSEVLEYIRGLGTRLTPYMGRDFDYQYFVVRDDSINAFALPGGKIFVNTGLIMSTKSEAELAGLLGHEIAHAVLSHGFQRLAQENLMNNLQQVIPVGNLFKDMVTKQYSRENERQADILGTRVLATEGYAADGLVNLMVILKKEYGDPSNVFLSSHPATSDRINYLKALIVNNGYNPYAYEGVKRHREIQEILKTQAS